MADTSATRYASYFNRYNDEAQDPFTGDYGNVMNAFTASTGRETATKANQLYEQVFTTTEVQPHIYLMLTQNDGGDSIVSVLHRPYRHVAPMGSRVPKLDVAFLGDMKGLLPPTLVYFPDAGFKHTGNLRVPRPETLMSTGLTWGRTMKTTLVPKSSRPGHSFICPPSMPLLHWPIPR